MQREYGHLYPKIVFVLDFIILNIIALFGLIIMGDRMQDVSFKWIVFLLNISYIPSAIYLQRFHAKRIIFFEKIVLNSLISTGVTGSIFLFLSEIIDLNVIDMRWFLTIHAIFFVLLSLSWLIERIILKSYRLRGGNYKTILIIGSSANAFALYHTFSSDPTMGYRPLGIIIEDDVVDQEILNHRVVLGKMSGLEQFLEQQRVDEIYSALPASMGAEILNLINLSEKNLIRYFFVPNYYNYVKRKVTIDYINNIPILNIRQEPLLSHWNSFLKRSFDIIFSLLVLVLLFPITLLVVGSLIKLSSKGPIFFKQLRTGLKGNDFYCYKFRSMKMNVDSDQMQATANDPRKTKIGEFIRKTSIDELPQFINVIMGDMSVVGPRPHMLKHTEMYSELVDKYMLRHFVKPGITGWAQVNGCRGETKTVEQMAQRVRLDIFYLENWSILLDIKIIFRTIFQISGGDKQAY